MGRLGRSMLIVAMVGATGCVGALPHASRAYAGGKPKGPPVSDVAPPTIPVGYEHPDVLPPKEPAINVLAKVNETESVR